MKFCTLSTRHRAWHPEGPSTNDSFTSVPLEGKQVSSWFLSNRVIAATVRPALAMWSGGIALTSYLGHSVSSSVGDSRLSLAREEEGAEEGCSPHCLGCGLFQGVLPHHSLQTSGPLRPLLVTVEEGHERGCGAVSLPGHNSRNIFVFIIKFFRRDFERRTKRDR